MCVVTPGEISVAGQLDREEQSSYNLIVQVRLDERVRHSRNNHKDTFLNTKQ